MIDWVSVEELDLSAESQLNTSGVNLNADLEPKTHLQTPMTCTYGYSHFRHFQNCCNRDGNTIVKYMNNVSVLSQFWKSQYLCPYSVCTGHWCLLMSFWLKVCFFVWCCSNISLWTVRPDFLYCHSNWLPIALSSRSSGAYHGEDLLKETTRFFKGANSSKWKCSIILINRGHNW